MRQPNPEVAERLVAHFRNDTTDLAHAELHVPIAHYTSDERATAECALMRRLPVIAAHGSEIAAPGDFVTKELLGVPLLIVRHTDGTVGAYRNMCRHRGGCVEPDSKGSKRVFVCRYHGWTYDRDGGALRNVPFESSYGAIDHAANGLARVRCEERHGLLWITLDDDGDGEAVADYLGPQVDSQLDDLGLDGSIVVLEQTIALEVNWKLVMDGAYDVVHPKFLHPDGVGKLFQSNLGVWFDYGRHGQLFTARKRLEALAHSGEPVEAAWRYIATNLVVYPNSMAIAAPEHVELWTVWPGARADESVTQIRFIVRPEVLDDAMEQRIHQSWEILSTAGFAEDWPMERSIQINANANQRGTFLYGRSEISCQHLHRQLAADLGD